MFSEARQREWNRSNLFRKVFIESVLICMGGALVYGKEMAAIFQQMCPETVGSM